MIFRSVIYEKNIMLARLKLKELKKRFNLQNRKSKQLLNKYNVEHIYKNNRLCDTAKILKTSRPTLRKYLKLHNIHIRTEFEERLLIPITSRGGYRNNRYVLSSLVRRKLLKWRRDVLERDGFTCQKCFSKEKLEVHHQKQLKMIIDEFLKNNNIDIKNCDFIRLSEGVINEHKLEYGITLCKKCHCEIDYYRNLLNEKIK